jgi:membrane associated rhomboid family serine protease
MTKAKNGIILLLILVALMWLVRAIDSFDNDGVSVAGWGIIPRALGGLSGILVAPIVHADWDHLLANTVPLLVLGILIALRGPHELLFVVLVTMFVSGIGCWLFGRPGQHIGASGIVLGFMSFLIVRSLYDRRLSSFLIALVVSVLYAGTAVLALMPHGLFSWTLHFFGLVGGALAANWRYSRG